MQLTSILQTTAANWANLTVKMTIDQMKQDLWVYYYLQLADTLMYILKDIFISIIKEQCLMKEKVYEDGTKAAKTLLMIYYAKINDNILWICPWQNERQRSFYNFWSCIVGNLLGDRLRPFINTVLAGFIGNRASLTLTAPFWNRASMEHQQCLVL